MNETGTLIERLKQQAKTENETILNLTQDQLRFLQNELKNILRQELNTITSDIQNQSKNIGWSAFKSRFMWPTIVGLSLSLGLFAGSLASMQYLSNQIVTLNATIQKLQTQGGKIKISRCGETGRLCAKINETAEVYQDGFRILDGY